jgi:hypothetical protein
MEIATADNDVAINILRAYRAAMTFQVAMTRIDRPRCLRDLASNQRLVARFAGADCEIGLAFGQIKKPVADHELDPQAGMTRVKLVYEIRSPQAICQDRSACDTNGAGKVFIGCGELTLESRHRGLDSLSGGPQFPPELGESVRREVSLNQPTPKPLLKL